MKTLDVENVPEPIVNALQTIIQMWKDQHNGKTSSAVPTPDQPLTLPTVKGGVIGSLSRAEIYDYLGERLGR